MQVLVAANALRLLILPYPTLLFGTGEHRRIRFNPFVEGVVNVGVSIALGLVMGPIGVAIGTLVGVAVEIGAHLWFNLPRTRSLALGPAAVLRRGLAGPMLVATPAVIALTAEPILPDRMRAVVFGLAVSTTPVLAWAIALDADDRAALWARLFPRPAPRLHP